MKPIELDHMSTKCAMKVSINDEQKSNGGRKLSAMVLQDYKIQLGKMVPRKFTNYS